jgi:hypothetical protein
VIADTLRPMMRAVVTAGAAADGGFGAASSDLIANAFLRDCNQSLPGPTPSSPAGRPASGQAKHRSKMGLFHPHAPLPSVMIINRLK